MQINKRHIAVALLLSIVAQSTSSSQHQAPPSNPGLPVEVSQLKLKRRKRRRKTQVICGDVGQNSLDDTSEMLGDAPKRKRRKKRRGITTTARQRTGGTQEMLIPIGYSMDEGPEDLGDRFDETGRAQLDSPTTLDVEASPDDRGDSSTESAPLKVDSEESSETISYTDEKTGEKYEKTIREEEETIEDSSIDGFVVTADVISSETFETVQDGESTTTFKVSKKRRQQRVRVSRSSTTAPGPSRRTQSVSTRDNECLRRVKREWREAVKMGVAFDWTTGHTINEQLPSDRNNYVRLGPLGKNLLRWHFSCQGPANSVYSTGLYHGKVILPRDYPGSPPRVQMLTPSGRFLCGHDICLSASNYHPESWTPRWTVLSLVDALRLHMLTTANEIGGVSASDEKRRQYAESSQSWNVPGVVDHGRMISEGIFPLLSDRKGGDAMNDDDVSHCELGNVPIEEDHAKVDRQLSQEGTGTDHPSTKQIKSKYSKQPKLSTEESPIPATQTNEGLGLIPLLLKRTLIESLKLPLRILSLILMSLTAIESRLRRILDNI